MKENGKEQHEIKKSNKHRKIAERMIKAFIEVIARATLKFKLLLMTV